MNTTLGPLVSTPPVAAKVDQPLGSFATVAAQIAELLGTGGLPSPNAEQLAAQGRFQELAALGFPPATAVRILFGYPGTLALLAQPGLTAAVGGGFPLGGLQIAEALAAYQSQPIPEDLLAQEIAQLADPLNLVA